MSKRYVVETKALDLRKFHSDPGKCWFFFLHYAFQRMSFNFHL